MRSVRGVCLRSPFCHNSLAHSVQFAFLRFAVRTLPLGVCCEKRSFATFGAFSFPLRLNVLRLSYDRDRLSLPLLSSGHLQISRPLFAFVRSYEDHSSIAFATGAPAVADTLVCSFVVPLFYHKFCICQDLFEKIFAKTARSLAIKMA